MISGAGEIEHSRRLLGLSAKRRGEFLRLLRQAEKGRRKGSSLSLGRNGAERSRETFDATSWRLNNSCRRPLMNKFHSIIAKRDEQFAQYLVLMGMVSHVEVTGRFSTLRDGFFLSRWTFLGKRHSNRVKADNAHQPPSPRRFVSNQQNRSVPRSDFRPAANPPA